MSAPTIHVTQGYNEPAFYPDCHRSNALLRAFERRTFNVAALMALQDLGVCILIDGQVYPTITSNDDRGATPIGDAAARLNRNDNPGE